MRVRIVLAIMMMLVLAGGVAGPALAQDTGQGNLADVRNATAKYQSISAAKAAGYQLVPGLDYCFSNPGVGGMGYHYINVSLLDTTLEVRKPEALVYAPQKNGALKLAAVEYIVPAAAWDSVHSSRPVLFGQTFGLEGALGVYELHVWIWKPNPSGIFNEWNPNVTCP